MAADPIGAHRPTTPEAAAKQDVRQAERNLGHAADTTEYCSAVHELMDAQNRLALIQGKPGALAALTDPPTSDETDAVGRAALEREEVARLAALKRNEAAWEGTRSPGRRETDATNPKDLLGAKKTNLHLVPSTSIIQQARAMENGAAKYGSFNWRDKEVRASIYISACLRHLYAWLDGEEAAKDSGIHHLGHATACLGILLDAQAMNKLVDDRSAGPAAVLLDYFDRSEE